MKYILLRSFVKKFDRHSTKEQEMILRSIEEILSFFSTQQAPYGLRIKQLSPKIYEARVNIHVRIAYFMEEGIIKFFCLGNHDDIEHCLKTLKKRSL